MNVAEMILRGKDDLDGVYAAGYNKAIDEYCPPFEESGYAVRCEPVVGYPLKVVSNLDANEDGYTEVSFKHGGKNIFDPQEYMQHALTDGRVSLSEDIFTVNFTNGAVYINNSQANRLFTNPGTYTLRIVPESEAVGVCVFLYKTDGTRITYKNLTTASGVLSMTFTVAEKFAIAIGGTSGSFGTHSFRVQLEVGSTATEFEPYATPEEYSVTIPMVYGGSYDWATGVLTSTHKRVAMKDLDWYYSEDNAYFFADLPGAGSGAAMCNKEFVHTPGEYSSITSGSGVVDFSFDIYGGGIAVICWDYDDVSDFKAFLDAEAITLLYPLAEPDVMEVATPQTIVGKAGVNTFISGVGEIEISGVSGYGYTDGEKSAYDRFWDVYQDNGTRTAYEYAFGGKGWTLDTFKPKYDMAVFTGTYMFANSQLPIDLPAYLEQIGVNVDLSAVASLTYMFQGSKVTRIGVIGCIGTSWGACYNGCDGLTTIDRMIVKNNQTYANTFGGCTALVNLMIDGVIGQSGFNVSVCPLSHDSLMSIINNLEAKTSGTWTVTLGTKNLAKLTDAEKAIATQKGWTLA